MKNKIFLIIFLSAFLPIWAVAQDASDALADKPADSMVEEQPMHFESKGSVRIDGKAINYTATAGTLVMKNEEGDPIAQFGYTSYTKDGADKGKRPIMFAYNGGPGSASFWLHMGVLGPKRVVIDDLTFNTAGPFKRVNNEHSILAKADLVMIDPVGTGFSHPVGEAKGEDFWGVDQDIASVSDFIARYITDNGRWQAP